MVAALRSACAWFSKCSFALSERLHTFKRFKMERKSFKEYSEAAMVEKRKASSDEILLRATSYVYINVGRYFFFNPRSGVLKNFPAAKGHYGIRNLIFRLEFMLI